MIGYRHLRNVANTIYDVARIRARTYAHARTHNTHVQTHKHTDQVMTIIILHKNNNSVYSLIVTSIYCFNFLSGANIHWEYPLGDTSLIGDPSTLCFCALLRLALAQLLLEVSFPVVPQPGNIQALRYLKQTRQYQVTETLQLHTYVPYYEMRLHSMRNWELKIWHEIIYKGLIPNLTAYN